jgi:exosortase
MMTAIYGPIMAGLVQDWIRESSLSYGLLVLPMAVYFAWIDRHAILSKPIVPDGRGMWLMGAASAMFIFGKLSATEYFYRLSLVVFVGGIIATFWGWQRFRVMGRPLILLVCMVPPPALVIDRLSLPLRLFASGSATAIARALGVSINQEGNIIHLAAISLGVEDACSGLNSLFAMLVTAVLLGFMYCGAVWLRSVLVLLAVPLACVFNILRIAGTAVMADYRPEAALGFYHLFSGWFTFVFGAAALFVLAWSLGKLEEGRSR